MVGVEGVPHAEGVGGEAQAQPEHPASDTGQLGGRNEGGQDPPAGDVKHEDEPRHAEDGPQLGASDGPTAQSFACHFSVQTRSLGVPLKVLLPSSLSRVAATFAALGW